MINFAYHFGVNRSKVKGTLLYSSIILERKKHTHARTHARAHAHAHTENSQICFFFHGYEQDSYM